MAAPGGVKRSNLLFPLCLGMSTNSFFLEMSFYLSFYNTILVWLLLIRSSLLYLSLKCQLPWDSGLAFLLRLHCLGYPIKSVASIDYTSIPPAILLVVMITDTTTSVFITCYHAFHVLTHLIIMTTP